VIEIEHLIKVFRDPRRGEVYAVNDVSFSCRKGSIVGLLGTNGAGKTTCLRIVATLLAPSGGTVRVDGLDVRTDGAQIRKKIGFLSASTGIYDRMTPYETLFYFGRLHGIERSELARRIEELLALLDMRAYRDVLGMNLSTGTAQKVSIARALVHDPDVLILDEPTAGLDIISARSAQDFILWLRDKGKSVLFSTHILPEARKLCDHLAVIHEGRLLGQGSPEELERATGARGIEEVFFQLVRGSPVEA